MTPEVEYDLCPGSNIKPVPLFKNQEEQDQFFTEFAASVKPELEKYRIARIKSEEHARHHRVD